MTNLVEFESKPVTSRRDRLCTWCNELINRGDRTHYRRYIFNGDFKANYFHLECFGALCDTESNEVFDDEGFIEGEQRRGEPINWENY